MADMSCLADGYVVTTDSEETGINNNEIIVGPTGCGKSLSNAYSRLVHTTDSSIVVPIAKKALKEKFSKMFEKRGYEVVDLDYAHPEKCTVGYDPLDYICRDEDVIQVARNFVGNDPNKYKSGKVDPYWDDSATSVLAAEISLVRLNARAASRKPCFGDVIELHRALKAENGDVGLFKTNLDEIFDAASRMYPGNQASELWKTVRNLAPRTASCILSVVNSALDKIFSESVIAMAKKEKRVDFRALGERKIALFITTSPMNKTLQNYVNVMYSDMFRALFEAAEEKENSRLQVPVHIICDDFACGSKINDFDEYISIFRAAGISVTMLLQSESQLASMYGDAAADIIINNSDTYVFYPGMDIKTCERVSRRMNKPLHKVLSMPMDKVIVFRRGCEPVVSQRYQILKDPVYQEVMGEREQSCKDL